MVCARSITQWEKTEIDELFAQAKRILFSPVCDIKVARAQKSYGRLLLIIPVLVGQAHERNLMRRRFKNLFYNQRLFEKGFDWIVFVKKPAVKISYSKLSELVTCTAQKLSDLS